MNDEIFKWIICVSLIILMFMIAYAWMRPVLIDSENLQKLGQVLDKNTQDIMALKQDVGLLKQEKIKTQ